MAAIMRAMRRAAPFLPRLPLGLLLLGPALAAMAGEAPREMVNRPRAGEQETAQAGGGSGRFSFVGDLRCPEGQAIVGARLAEGPLLNFLELACAPLICEAGQCRWRAATVLWGPSAGARSGRGAAHLCPATAVVSGFRAAVVAVGEGAAVRSLSVQCAPLAGLSLSGHAAIGRSDDPRVTRIFLPPLRAAEGTVTGACRDRGVAAFSVAVGLYPSGAGGEGSHVRAVSAFCRGLVE